ncbi:HNH endonuclease [Candidatus Rhodoblastus alkanivorans]|uniref:HNH endonuclease n=2 Tax=Candidatus Rhodoblastus alkanivorans TaxID=2954117 RepID=A0ABS9Z8G7_9HYPH|nr:HNH endonuclease [Candidatus Rhodoblastus alkanivorans]MCI4683492.1 HNH endonuclease [Candidatus Rhodoblastus alkanivorans]
MICSLCRRPLGVKVEAHHLTPRTFGGRETVPRHPICHRKIHTALSEREFMRAFHTIEALRGHVEIARFIAWVTKKDPDFYAPTFDSKTRKAKRKR